MMLSAYTEAIGCSTTKWQLGTRTQCSLRYLRLGPVKHVHFRIHHCLPNGNALQNRAISTYTVPYVQTDSRSTTIREICKELLPEDILDRAEELGFVHPTDVQVQALPLLLSGRDCILHSQTGSGKTLCYLFAIFARLNLKRSAVQAIIVVPTRELGMQVVKEARKLCKVPNSWSATNKRSVNAMALLDGGSLYRQKSWLKADPPEIVVGTVSSICKMIELKKLKTNAISTLIIDEVDAIFGKTEHVALLRTLITSYIPSLNRQTIFASATIPQHAQFVRRCVNEKWTNDSLTHVHINHINKMPTNLVHRHVVCEKYQKLHVLKKMLCEDMPKASMIFVNEQSEASKRKGILPSTAIVAEFLSSLCSKDDDSRTLKPLVLEEDSNVNARTFTLADFPHENNILVTTDIAGRGLDIPEVSHVYNFELPPSATSYIHRGGRTARRPIDLDQGIVTTFLSESELFVYQKYENEIGFQSTKTDIS